MGREVADKLREPSNIPKNMALIISQICQWGLNQRRLISTEILRMGGGGGGGGK
jgi:hypothetical protein